MTDFTEKLPKFRLTRGFDKNLPQSAGVYIFFKETEPIYIGKAINLRRRVKSYFDLDLEAKTAKMIGQANYFSYIRVVSEFEALLLEAKLIRKYQPHYNIAAKDDKHPLYIRISKEKFPVIQTCRKIDLNDIHTLAVYGPFPSTKNVRFVLKFLRRIFPFSDHKLGKKRCFYSHLGLCQPCPNHIASIKDRVRMANLRREYLRNIRGLKSILDGNIEKVRKDLVGQMEAAAKIQDFETAVTIRDQIGKLEYITRPQMPSDSYLENPNLYEDVRVNELSELTKILVNWGVEIKNLSRIECFDVAHLSGTNPTASMITFINGEADKNYYRHFRIRQIKGNSDADSLREVIQRRAKHFEDWGRPDLIIVDGGKPQVSVFLNELKNEKIPVVGLAKRFETLVIPAGPSGTMSLKEYRLPKGVALNLVQRIRDEAHRFARVYHHKLIFKSLSNQ
jgi:excinuclease ABC subunit C